MFFPLENLKPFEIYSSDSIYEHIDDLFEPEDRAGGR
jgi:hypothetical protein